MGSWLDELLGISAPGGLDSTPMIPQTRMPVPPRWSGMPAGRPGVKIVDRMPAPAPAASSQDWNFLDWVNGGSGFPSAGSSSAGAFQGIGDPWAHALLRAHGYVGQAPAPSILDQLGLGPAPAPAPVRPNPAPVQPGTLPFLMHQLDGHYRSDGFYQANRDKIKYRIQDAIDPVHRDPRLPPFSVVEARNVVNDMRVHPAERPNMPVTGSDPRSDAQQFWDEVLNPALATMGHEVGHAAATGVLRVVRGFNWGTGRAADGLSELLGNGPISPQAKRDAAQMAQSMLEAAQRARHHASNAISKAAGFGDIDPSIYRNDAASRISDEVADAVPYFIPGVGEGLGGVQMGLQVPQLAHSIEQNGVRSTAAGVWDSMNPAASGLHPDERVMRALNLGLMGKSALESVGKAAGAVRGAVRVPPRVSQVLESVAARHLAPQEFGGIARTPNAEADVQFGQPGAPPLANPPDGVPALFTTESGHVYDLHGGGVTNRYVHDGDRFHQLPRSSSTFYVSPEDAAMLAGQAQRPGNTISTFLDPETGALKAGLKFLNGPLEGQFHPGSVVDALSTPQKGLVPVETFGQGTSPAFGDRIAGIDYTPSDSGSSLEAETYGPNLEYTQYRLEAKKLGMYPVMTRGFKEPTDWVRLDAGEHWKYGQTKRGELRYDPRFLDDLNLKFVGETYHDSVAGARAMERSQILIRKRADNGNLLPGNKIIG